LAEERATRQYRFRQVDVFTERPLAGNPLAVFLDPGDLSDQDMRAIALEMNLSETTFVFPSTRADCVARVRIFTPRREVPFAGHPTLGTAFVLASEGRLLGRSSPIALEEGIGPVEVWLEGDVPAPSFIWMRHRTPVWEDEVTDRAGIVEALGLSEADLIPGAPIQVGSTGSPFLFIPLRDRQTVDRAQLDVSAFTRLSEAPKAGIFAFAPEPDPSAGRVYSRMFAPHTSGVPEDPATGSASGPLGAYLVRHRMVRSHDDVRIVSEQGTKMGRQSFVHIRGTARDGELQDIRVGGQVVPVLEGTLRLPSA